MNKDVKEYAVARTHELMEAGSCCPEAKAAAKMWLEALGTAGEAEKTKMYLAELEEDVTTIDGLIAFSGSDAGRAAFGDAAAGILAHAKEIKAAGGKYCDCPACTAALAILGRKAELLA
jgi:hypothetical protein